MTHTLAMDLMGRVKRAETVAHLDSYGNLATKMLRTFTMQSEALAKLRRGGEQTVRVEHVHVYEGGQAIVGTVSQERLGVQHENANRAHETIDARALAIAPAPLRGEDPIREAMPAGRDHGQGAVPTARRRKGLERAEGRA